MITIGPYATETWTRPGMVLQVVEISLSDQVGTGSFLTKRKSLKTVSSFNFSRFKKHTPLGGGFKYFLCSPLFGEDSHFD